MHAKQRDAREQLKRELHAWGEAGLIRTPRPGEPLSDILQRVRDAGGYGQTDTLSTIGLRTRRITLAAAARNTAT